MPHTIMNGITAHAFAFVMTAMVVAYPSANDFLDTVFEPEPSPTRFVASEIDRSFPDADGTIRPEIEIIRRLEACTQTDTAGRLLRSTGCQGVIEAARSSLSDEGMAPSRALIEAKLTLANTLLCRQSWTEAKAAGKTFDVQACEDRIIALADNT